MKFAALILAMFLAAVSAAGQVALVKDDTPESRYLLAEADGEAWLKKANYRSVWTKEDFENRSKAATLQEKKLREVIQPNKWRMVEETVYDKPFRREIVADGKAFYCRMNDEPWSKCVYGTGVGGRIESGQVKNQYRYLPAIDFEGKKADFYEHISIRTANKFSQTDFVVVRYVRTTRVWYATDGKIFKKTEETAIEGREEMLRETTTYEYDPKDLKIEAPAVK